MQDSPKAQLAPGEFFRGSTAESEEVREFLKERVALFAKVIFVLCTGFYFVGNAILCSFHGWSIPLWFEPVDLYHLAACVVLGILWVFAARLRTSALVLRWVDLVCIVAACVLYAVASWELAMPGAEYSAVLGVATTLLAHSTLVPYPASQTVWTGILAYAPTIVISYFILNEPYSASDVKPPGVATAFIAVWSSVVIILSTVISRIIFGLRRQVREARRLGQYTIEDRLGSGGMGVVYKARHALLRRPTAIKMMRCDLAGERNISRFEREVQLTSVLTHPNTVAIYDYGRTPDGLFYYAMEYLDGITLDELVEKDGPQPPGRVIHLLDQVCGSLAEAHGVGMIHRDIKAANVILVERGWVHDMVKVVDFGLVKEIVNVSGVTQSAVTTLAGTPHYLPPEAIRAPDSVDPRSDLYAVGVLGYFLLTGKHLFEAKSFVEICGHHLHTAPVPPSARLERSVPRDLEGLILMCLEKDPARRPRDAAALRRALAACEDAQAWSDQDAREWWKAFRARPKGAKPTSREGTSASPPTVESFGKTSDVRSS